MTKVKALSLLERLARLDSAALSDALDRQGLSGVVEGVKPLTTEKTISGRVTTVKLARIADLPADKPKRHLASSAIEAGDRDTIIVIENLTGENTACWGGTLSLAAVLRGIGGVVVEGFVRDLDEARGLDFAVYGRGSTPRASRGRIGEMGWNEPIMLGNVRIEAHDYILADQTGVAIIPVAHIEATLAIAEEIVAREALMAASLRAGHEVSVVMEASYESLLENNPR
jgi:4-hydroxy-4-methyl-2-oxoglutarate aldolase